MFSPTLKSILTAAALLLAVISDHAQSPSKFDPKQLTPGRNTLACYTVKNDKAFLIGTMTFGLHTTVSTLSTFKPIYRQVDIFSNGLQVQMIDMETDFNSTKAPFRGESDGKAEEDEVDINKSEKRFSAVFAGRLFYGSGICRANA